MLVLPVALAANLFAERLPVFDVTHGRDARGVSTPVQSADRVISGTFQPAGDSDAKWLPEGFTLDAARVLHTAGLIYAQQSTGAAVETRQTYVRWGNQLWKVWRPQHWGNVAGGMQRYLATVYEDANGVIV